MSENNVNGIAGADVATTTGIIGATIGIGQYIINDYVITLAETEGDYGYTMTITRGTDTQTVTLYGLTPEQYDAMLGYLEQAQAAARGAQSDAESAGESAQAAEQSAYNAGVNASSAASAKDAARTSATRAASDASAAASAKNDAVAAKTDAQIAKVAAETAQSAAEAAQTAAQAAETSTQTYASQTFQSAENAAQSAASAAQTLTQVQTEGAAQIAAIDAEGQRVLDSIPEDYTELEEQVWSAYPTASATGNPAEFGDAADGIPIKALTVALEPSQPGSGDPSPSNVRPVTSRTGITLTVNGSAVTISWETEAGTVYGGTLDVATGLLTVDRVSKTISNAAQIARNNATQYYVYASATPDIRPATGQSSVILSDKFAPAGASYATSGVCFLNNATIRFNTFGSYDTVADMLADIGPMQFVYPIAEPLTYQINAAEVRTMLGDNTIGADAGTVTVTYHVDPDARGNVNSVAGKTGEVTLDAGDVSYDDQQTYEDGTVGAGLAELKSQMTAIDAVALGAYPTDTAMGRVVEISDGAEDLPVKDFIIDIKPIFYGIGTPSPENIMPFRGWNEIRIGVCDYKFSTTGSDQDLNFGGLHFVITENMSHLKIIGTANQAIQNLSIPLASNLEQDTYYMYNIPVGYKNMWAVSISGGAVSNVNGVAAIPIVSNRLSMFTRLSTGDKIDVDFYPIVSDKPPIIVHFPLEVGTVYGGTFDALSGTLKVYPYYESYNGETLVGAWISSMEVYTEGATPTIGAQVVDMGATPTIYQLDPVDIRTFKGTNYICADTGDTTVTYRADPTLYINRRLSELSKQGE